MNDSFLQCDTCKFKQMNYDGKRCPNYSFFFKTFMNVCDNPSAMTQKGHCNSYVNSEDSE